MTQGKKIFFVEAAQRGEVRLLIRCFPIHKLVKMKQKKKSPKKKSTAKIVHRSGNNFWTTQKQFWAWVRSGIIEHTGDNPLKGIIVNDEEFKFVMRNHTILNLAAPNHLSEVVRSKRLKK